MAKQEEILNIVQQQGSYQGVEYYYPMRKRASGFRTTDPAKKLQAKGLLKLVDESRLYLNLHDYKVTYTWMLI